MSDSLAHFASPQHTGFKCATKLTYMQTSARAVLVFPGASRPIHACLISKGGTLGSVREEEMRVCFQIQAHQEGLLLNRPQMKPVLLK
jgi:hypothetical protein